MIDIELAREHIKADDEDVEDALIEQYIASAKTICEGYCNRKFYDDEAERLAAFNQALLDQVTVDDDYDAAISAATNDSVRGLLTNDHIRRIGEIRQQANGVITDDTITAAMLMTLGHLYKNRQEVIAGQQSSATWVPAGAQRMLQPYLWIGDLA